MEKEKLYWLGFSLVEGIGPKRLALLLDYFGSAEKAWLAKETELLALGLGPKLTASLIKARQKFDLRSVFLRLRENKVTPVFLGEKNYPENLKKIDSPPFVLYVKGRILPQDDLSLAVVGSRQMTAYGKQAAASLVTALVAAGMTIVSGLARGIDSQAHRAALKAGGRTIAVLGCGLDRCYPPENEGLVKEIINGRGAVVSEYPLGRPPLAANFPARNRIIAGLALGTVVIEGSQKSGTLITARHTAEQGREVFAVPGPITSRLAAGPAYLIKMGAKLVFDIHDILEELKIEPGKKKPPAAKKLPVSREEALVLSLIQDKAKNMTQLVRESGLSAGQVVSSVSMLAIKGQVKKLGQMVYAINISQGNESCYR